MVVSSSSVLERITNRPFCRLRPPLPGQVMVSKLASNGRNPQHAPALA